MALAYQNSLNMLIIFLGNWDSLFLLGLNQYIISKDVNDSSKIHCSLRSSNKIQLNDYFVYALWYYYILKRKYE